jgi:hypothetical protein
MTLSNLMQYKLYRGGTLIVLAGCLLVAQRVWPFLQSGKGREAPGVGASSLIILNHNALTGRF